MLAKMIDLGSIPMGLGVAKEELTKGRLVKFDPATKEVTHAKNIDEADGFCTFRIETEFGGDIADHDTIKAGKRVVIYTLVNRNMWRTTEIEGLDKLKAGDFLTCGADGKLKKSAKAGEFVFYDHYNMGSYSAGEVMYVGAAKTEAEGVGK